MCLYYIYVCVCVCLCMCAYGSISLRMRRSMLNDEQWTLNIDHCKRIQQLHVSQNSPLPPPLPFPHPTPSPPNNSLQHCFSTVWFFTLYIQLTSENHGQNFFFFTCSNTALIVAVTVRWENYCNCSQWLLCETKYQSTTKVSS